MNAEFVKKLQFALNSAFSSAPTRFLPGAYPQENPAWESTEKCRRYIKDRINHSLRHLFGDCDGMCDHKADYVHKTGSAVTCPVEQGRIRAIVQEKVIDQLPNLVLEGVGPVNTNRCETVGYVRLMYRCE